MRASLESFPTTCCIVRSRATHDTCTTPATARATGKEEHHFLAACRNGTYKALHVLSPRAGCNGGVRARWWGAPLPRSLASPHPRPVLASFVDKIFSSSRLAWGVLLAHIGTQQTAALGRLGNGKSTRIAWRILQGQRRRILSAGELSRVVGTR